MPGKNQIDREPLQTRISVLERQLVERRQRLTTAVTVIPGKFRSRLASPAMLFAMFGLGVVVEQRTHWPRWSLLTALNMVNAIGALLLTLTYPTKVAAAKSSVAPGSTQSLNQ